MIEFVCKDCGQSQYSASEDDKPCIYCGSKNVEKVGPAK